MLPKCIQHTISDIMMSEYDGCLLSSIDCLDSLPNNNIFLKMICMRDLTKYRAVLIPNFFGRVHKLRQNVRDSTNANTHLLFFKAFYFLCNLCTKLKEKCQRCTLSYLKINGWHEQDFFCMQTACSFTNLQMQSNSDNDIDIDWEQITLHGNT